MIKEIIYLKQSLDEYKYQLKAITSQNEYLNEETDKLKRIIDDSSKTQIFSENFYRELEDKLQSELVKRKQLEKDLETSSSHRHRLEEALSKAHNNLDEIQSRLNQEKQYAEKMLSEIDGLKAIHSKDKENITYLLKDTQDQAQDEISRISDDNKLLKENVLNLNYEISNLNALVAGKSSNIGEFRDRELDYDEKITALLDENHKLKIALADLENKNKQLFDHLDKELAARAREYKEKTLTMLSTPIRNYSSSPLVNRQNKDPYLQSNLIQSRNNLSQEHQDRFASATSRILENSSIESPIKNMRKSSPSKNSPEKVTPLKNSSSTPSKEDIKRRIAALAESRSRLEMKIEELNL